MRVALRTAFMCLCLAGCLDLNVLQAGLNEPDMALPEDMASPIPDMATTPVDMRTPPADMANPDMATPFQWTNVTPVVAPGRLFAVSGTASGGTTTLYIPSTLGTMLKSSNAAATTFATVVLPTPATTRDLTALWVKDASTVFTVDSNGETYATTNGGVLPTDWANKMSTEGTMMRAVYGQAASDSVLIGGDNTTRALSLKPSTGTSWTAANATTAQTKRIYGIWASATNYIIVGDNRAAKCSDPVMTCTALSKNGFGGSPMFLAVHGTADNNVWIVTDDGQLIQTDLTDSANAMNKRTEVAGSNFAALWVRSATEVWVVGRTGSNHKVWQCNATSCTDRTGTLPNTHTLTGIWGDGAGALWVVGNNGTAGGIFKH